MDWKGQALAEKRAMKMMVIGCALAFFVGYFMQSFMTTIYVYAATVVATILVTGPNWAAYNKHPITFVAGKDGRKDPATGFVAKVRLLFS